MKYIFSTIIAGSLWGIISLFLKPLSDNGFSPIQIMFARNFLSTIILLFVLLLKNKKLLKFCIKDIWMFIGTGVISLTFFSLCYFTSILNLGVSIAVILLYTSPIFVLILSIILFKEKLTLIKIICLIMTFCGCILVTGIGSVKEINMINIFIGICAGFGYAFYSIFSRCALAKYSPLTVTFYTFVFSSISIIPFCNFPQFINLLTITNFIQCLGIAFFCTILPYILYTFGLSGLDNSKAAILATAEPLVGTIVGLVVWSECIHLSNIIGIIFILTAIILLGMQKNKQI